jgi:Resolvase, N terminal domain
VRKCREYAAAHGLSVPPENIFIDEAVSGVGADRPELQRMMTAALSPSRPFAAILIDDTSRLSRSMQDTLAIFEKLIVADLKALFSKDTMPPRAELLKHVQESGCCRSAVTTSSITKRKANGI